MAHLRIIPAFLAVLCGTASAPTQTLAQAGIDPVVPTPQVSGTRDTDGPKSLSPPLRTLTVATRAEALGTMLDDMQRPSRAYWYTWVSVQTALTAGQSILGAAAEKGSVDRGSYFIGAGISAFSLSLLLIGRYPARYAASQFRALPTSSPGAQEARLATGEKWLHTQARADEFSTSLLRHSIGLALALGSGLGVGLAYDDAVPDAIIRGVSTLVVSELQIWTRPTRSIRYDRSYKTATEPAQFSLVPTAGRDSQGIMFTASF
jgi:hypothetical protein